MTDTNQLRQSIRTAQANARIAKADKDFSTAARWDEAAKELTIRLSNIQRSRNKPSSDTEVPPYPMPWEFPDLNPDLQGHGKC